MTISEVNITLYPQGDNNAVGDMILLHVKRIIDTL